MAKSSHEEYVAKVYSKVGDEYSVIGAYTLSKFKITMKHNICSNIYQVTPASFINGNRCPKCSMLSRLQNQPKSHNVFIREVFEKVANEYTVIGKYISSNKKITMRHNVCNKEYLVAPVRFLVGSKCPHCAINSTKTNELFLKQVYDLVNDEYEPLDTYVSTHSKLLMKHNVCGESYMVAPHLFLMGTRCPNCKASKGETKIANWLKSNSITYVPQYKIKECSYKRPLAFDFGIFDKNNRLLCLIEFDGEQHFRPIKFFGGEAQFKENVLRDSIKNTYCKNNHINLLRISYLEFNNIEKILSEHFKTIR